MVNVVRHTVKTKAVQGGADGSAEKIRCEIILDMFGKHCLVTTAAGRAMDGHVTCAFMCRMTVFSF